MSNLNILSISNLIPQWPDDCMGQTLYFERLKSVLDSLNQSIFSQTPATLYIESATEPSQGDWETKWTTDIGLSLPILAGTNLIWYDTNQQRIGGLFTTIEGDSTIYRREHKYPSGSIVAYAQNQLNSSQSLATNIQLNNALMPSVSIFLPLTCDIEITAGLNTVLSSGSGNWGVDFQVNGGKVGTVSYGVNTDEAMFATNASNYLSTRILLENQPAGNYTIQLMFGVSGAIGPTIAIGGNYGYRTLSAKAIVS